MSIWLEINQQATQVNALCKQLDDLQRETDMQECNGNYQRLVAYRILQTGKTPENLTLGELQKICAGAQKEFNAEMAAWGAQRICYGH